MGTPARHACLCFPTSGPWPRTSRHLGDSLPAHPYVLAPTVSCPLGICPFLGQKLGDTVCTLSLLGSCECEREWGIAECKQAPWSTLDGCACPSAGSGSRLRGKQGLQRGQMFPVTARFEARTPPPTPNSCHGRNCSSNLGGASAPPPKVGGHWGSWVQPLAQPLEFMTLGHREGTKDCMLGSASRRRAIGPSFTIASAARVGCRG